MENASKALLMAAGVLIGILIISLAVYLFVSFGSTSAEIHKQNEAQQIAQFNSQFISYEGKECTIYDVITVANLATENNKYYGFSQKPSNQEVEGTDNYISVKLKNNNLNSENQGFIEGSNTQNKDYEKIIKNDLQKITEVDDNGNSYKVLTKYKCTAKINTKTQRVYYVEFNTINN